MMRDDKTGHGRAACQGLTGEALERHLFLCAECRADVRLSSAWDALRQQTGEGPAPPRFTESVLEAVRTQAAWTRRRHLLLAAAAVLLFFFAAGANSRGPAPVPSTAEEVYAGLATPSSALEALLPE
jgi:hypothetical protein